MLNLPAIFGEATISQQHAILREVFKEGLTFREGMFRTPWIHPEFIHNLHRIKQLWLLDVEQPNSENLILSSGGEGGFVFLTPKYLIINALN